MTTQKQRILSALVLAGNDGVCLRDVDTADSYTLRNRISELRKTGHAITAARCRKWDHQHEHAVQRYFLEIK